MPGMYVLIPQAPAPTFGICGIPGIHITVVVYQVFYKYYVPLTMFTTVAAAMSSLVLLLLLMLVFPAVTSTCVSRLRQKYAQRAGGAFCYQWKCVFFLCSFQHLIRLMILFLTTGNPSCLLTSRPLP